VLKSKGSGTRGLLVNHFGDSFGMLRKPLKISGRTLWPAATSVTVTFFSYSFYTPISTRAFYERCSFAWRTTLN